MSSEKIRDYEIIDGPFNGTYGSVKIGCHPLGMRRAIKQLHEHVKPNIIREEALKQMNVKSPYVVQIYDFFDTENAILMEYCPVGLDRYLKGRLKQTGGIISYEEAREILYGILQGLNDAHAVGVIHGDIKPANVRFGAGEAKDDLGLPKLSDFGAARRVREDVPGIRGSTNWMAPEVIDGGTPTEASDYFSYGVLAYLVLCGHHPYFAADPSCLIGEEDNITDVTFMPVPLGGLRTDIPVEVANLVMELLSRDTTARLTAEKELKAALSHPMDPTPEQPSVVTPATVQPSESELTELRDVYENARRWFFVLYRPHEAVKALETFLAKFQWNRFVGAGVTPLADCWSLKAYINNSGGRYPDAVEAASNGISVYPQHVSSLHARAYAQTQLGRYSAAMADLKLALSLPANPSKRRQMSQLLETVKDRQPNSEEGP